MVKTSPSINESWDTVCSPHNLTVAWARVKGNEGSPGVDRVTIAEFESNLEENLTDLAIRLDQGDYLPLPVLRTHIAKQDGGQRPIGIPAVRDRIVQQSLLSVLSPTFDRQFLDCSFAYRPGRSALDAIRRVEMLLTEGHKWVLDADIERFFETVDHELLLKFVAETILDQRILDLIQRFLKTGVFDNMSLREEYLGITQGSALSPLLANIYLHRFDRQMLEGNYHLIRYADDFLILEDSEERIGRAMADAALTLNNLKLSLSQKKTRLVAASAGFTFLGYHFDARGKGPSKKSAQAIQRRLDNARQADGRRSFAFPFATLKSENTGSLSSPTRRRWRWTRGLLQKSLLRALFHSMSSHHLAWPFRMRTSSDSCLSSEGRRAPMPINGWTPGEGEVSVPERPP